MIKMYQFLVFLIIFSSLSSCQTIQDAEEKLNLSELKIKNNFVNETLKEFNLSKKNPNNNVSDVEIKAIEQNVWDFSQMGEYQEAYKLAKKYGIMCKSLVENQKQRIDYWENDGNKKIK